MEEDGIVGGIGWATGTGVGPPESRHLLTWSWIS